MRHLKIAGLVLAPILVAGMMLAGGAAAFMPSWLLCLNGSNANNTKYEGSSCTKASASGEWESVAIGSKSDTVKIQPFTLLFLDTKATGGSTGIRCGKPTIDWGVVSNTNVLTIESIRVGSPNTECERVEGGCKSGEVESMTVEDLPWKVEGLETEGKIIGKVEGDGNGEPAWEVECNTMLGKMADTCMSEAGKPIEVEVANELVGGVLLVRAVFLQTNRAKCSQGGAGAGVISGLIAILLYSGSGLSMKEPAPGPLWLLCAKGAPSPTKYEDDNCVKSKVGGEWGSEAIRSRSDTVKIQPFTLLLLDTSATGGRLGIRCGKPSASWGLISSFNLLLVEAFRVETPKTECERVEGGCKAGEVEKVEGVRLPWKEEVLETEGKFVSKIEGDGNGEPGWVIECNTLLGKVADTCTSESGKPEEVGASNETVGGVLLVHAVFLRANKAKCTQGGTGTGVIVGLAAILLWSGLGLSLNKT